MTQQTASGISVEGLSIVYSRTFDAPRELVFDVWTKPEHLVHWWGPRYVTLGTCDVDLRVGGGYRYVQKDAEGNEYAFHGEYREVVRPERLLYTFVFEMMPDKEAIEDIHFIDESGKTLMSGRTHFPTEEDLQGAIDGAMTEGMAESFARFEEYLATMRS